MKRWHLRDFARDTSGAVLVYTATVATAMLGFVGLAMDLGSWYSAKRDMQSAADAGATTAVLELARGATTGEMETRTKQVILLNGYTPGEVTINNPPLAGDYSGNANYVEVIVSQPQSGFVSGILQPDDVAVRARAVSTVAGAPACVIALNPGDDAVLSAQGSAQVDLSCGAQANSTSGTALSQTGDSYIHADSIQTSGSYEGSNFVPDPMTDAPPTNDPFSYLMPPTDGPCLQPAGAPMVYPSSFSGTIPAGNYCGGIEIQGADVDFEPGVYTVGEVGLHITGSANVTGDDVTLYFPDTVFGQPSSAYPDPSAPANRSLYIAGATSTVLTAPTGGAYQGILFYQDPNSDPDLIWEITGDANMSLGGTLYAPSNDIYFAGNQAAAAANLWTAVIGDEMHFVGSSKFGGGLNGANLPLALVSPSLVE